MSLVNVLSAVADRLPRGPRAVMLCPTEALLAGQGRPLLATSGRASAASPERLPTAPGPGCASPRPHVRARTAGRAGDGETDSTLPGHPHTVSGRVSSRPSCPESPTATRLKGGTKRTKCSPGAVTTPHLHERTRGTGAEHVLRPQEEAG